MNELIKHHDFNVVTTQGSVVFEEYDELLSQAQNLAEHVKTVEVDEENIKEAKDLMAQMNKRVKSIEDTRKQVKKLLLEPYNSFESQVKTIKSVIDNAVSHIRIQERELVEREREEKKQAIVRIFDKRIQHYDFEKVLGLADFLKPQHLNKSYSMTKVEKDLVDWLEKSKRDLEVIYQSEDTEDLIIEYQNTQDLSMAFDIVNKRKERKKQVEQAKQQPKNNLHVFIINNDKDAQLAKLLLEQNNIEFTQEIK
ncbi:DUF1351 domain-containing protein [Staphylococcus aureus]|uniref:DUF1351 domain-containing protein n=1 Tax=Staphylococcus aureus TaxID=1280 RepID=UPI0018E92280|nr:DUF1351 domain-containing protein [Staphylococcus aureus]MBJ6141287.1 DUF1351 domain-containing protein [Staphylococcus aureus]MBJ6151963.1 DUF1351 domain-containing protein [Staphylococcus aureus]MBJ6154170.1 DUF1351 domain-containing protein [Staphylococcus aureus]MBJ6156957.1 DUF1351 domain-containing protein [Staphylococcus aureus]MBJ6159639.1 DUF1351 domain-containing protein [Staphylococcus aureus]